MYVTTRYYYLSHILCCKWLCCLKKRGKLDEFRERMIVKLLADKETKNSFLRYCTEEEKISPEMKKNVKEYLEEKIGNKKKKKRKKNRRYTKETKRIAYAIAKGMFNDKFQWKAVKGDKYDIPSIQPFASDKERVDFLKDFVEKVKKDPEYKGETSILGINRKKNISLRLKEGKKNKIIFIQNSQNLF